MRVYETLAGGRRPVDQFEIDAKSGRKPGMAETVGVGALAGDAAIAAGVGVAGAVASVRLLPPAGQVGIAPAGGAGAA